jgi:hypothetical protein
MLSAAAAFASATTSASRYARIYGEALTPADKSAAMFTRIAILFEVLADRRGCPERMR